MILKKRQLLLATLVIALGAAVFINRYYNAPKAESAATAADNAAQKEAENGANLGDARYVISTDVTLDDAAAQGVINIVVNISNAVGKPHHLTFKGGG